MTLKTRKPSGNPAWPLILVEGEEKAGKSFALAQLSASPLVGRTFVWDLGDGTMDEYASLGPYEIVETNGTFTDLRESIREAVAIPPEGGKPNVYGIDSGTDLWDLLKRWTDGRARNSRAGQKALKDDPDAEIDPSTNLWNDAKDRWASIVNLLLRAPGIGVITAQGSEVMAFENGQPTNKTTWSVQAEKTLPRASTAWVRVQRDPRSATLIGVRRLGLEIPKGGLALPLDNTLHSLVFDVIGAGAQFATPKATRPQVGMTVAKAKQRLVGAVKANLRLDEKEAVAEAGRVWAASPLSAFEGDAEVPVDAVADLLASLSDPGDEGPDDPEGQGAGEDDPAPVIDPAAIVKAMSKPDAKAALEARGLATDGDIATLRARLLAALIAPEAEEISEIDRLMERAADPSISPEERQEIADALEALEDADDGLGYG